MSGELDPDKVVDEMGEELFAKWLAYDNVVPMDHTEQMLGFIAWMMGSYFGQPKMALRKLATPWYED